MTFVCLFCMDKLVAGSYLVITVQKAPGTEVGKNLSLGNHSFTPTSYLTAVTRLLFVLPIDFHQ